MDFLAAAGTRSLVLIIARPCAEHIYTSEFTNIPLLASILLFKNDGSVMSYISLRTACLKGLVCQI